LTLRRCAGG